jgi:hypothetical protein
MHENAAGSRIKISGFTCEKSKQVYVGKFSWFTYGNSAGSGAKIQWVHVRKFSRVGCENSAG